MCYREQKGHGVNSLGFQWDSMEFFNSLCIRPMHSLAIVLSCFTTVFQGKAKYAAKGNAIGQFYYLFIYFCHVFKNEITLHDPSGALNNACNYYWQQNKIAYVFYSLNTHTCMPYTGKHTRTSLSLSPTVCGTEMQILTVLLQQTSVHGEVLSASLSQWTSHLPALLLVKKHHCHANILLKRDRLRSHPTASDKCPLHKV